MDRDIKAEEQKQTIGRAEIIFGEKIVFMDFPVTCSLKELLRKSIVKVAASIKNSYVSVQDADIDLKDYSEFFFYLEDYSGRHISLTDKEQEFSSILLFFSYRLVIHIHLSTINNQLS